MGQRQADVSYTHESAETSQIARPLRLLARQQAARFDLEWGGCGLDSNLPARSTSVGHSSLAHTTSLREVAQGGCHATGDVGHFGVFVSQAQATGDHCAA